MIYSKLCSNVFRRSKDNLISSQRCTGIFNQNCLFYSNADLDESKSGRSSELSDQHSRRRKERIDQLLRQRNVMLNSRRFLYLNPSTAHKRPEANGRLPALYRELPKALSTQVKDEFKKLEFKRVNTEGNLNLVQTGSPLELAVPRAYIPYIELLRLNRFTGTMFLLYPCLWSIALAGAHGDLPDYKLMGSFFMGAVLMRSAGCIVNDLMDKDFDKQVERTKLRPLAAGTLTTTEAVAALAACLTGALNILLTFDCLTIMYGASSLLLVGLYPLMKRFTNWPQLFLGFTFNWGAILGWSAMQNGIIDWQVVLPLYASGIFWTLIYDTIYAYQDHNHDKKLGLKSTTMVFGDQPKFWLNTFAAGMTGSWLLTGYLSGQLYPFYLGVACSAIHQAYIIRKLNIKDPNNCFKQFRHCQLVGYYVLMGIMLSMLFDSQGKPKKFNVEAIDLRDDRSEVPSDEEAVL